MGISASAWPRAIGSVSADSGSGDPASNTAAEQASRAVSMARIRKADAPVSGRADQTAWTSRTSGRKWRSRFWMPCFSVAVEDGQPEQDPFMVR